MEIPVQVTPDDIGWVEQHLKPRVPGCRLSFKDDQRKAVLNCSSTRDINACAGSGKTTLLAAKLAILLNKWPYAQRGIAVLSHTNKALENIALALPSGTGVRAQCYPHFVGTIQSFIDRYLAAPICVQRFGVRPSPCEPTEFGRMCMSAAYKGDFGKVLTRLRMRKNQEPEDYLGKMVFEAASDRLDGRPLLLTDPDSPTFRELAALKLAMSRMGRFTYGDMVSLSELAVVDLPVIVRLVQQRFPVVLIDEAQDTSPRIESLLERVFANGSVVQRFGDPNQAIYGSDHDCYARIRASFPHDDALSLSGSTRLSPDVALLVGKVTVSNYCITSERSGCIRRPNTVFVFTADTIGRVLPSFGDLVLSTFEQQEITAGRVVALGGVQKPEETDQHRGRRRVKKISDGFPKSLCDYWGDFTPKQKQPKTRLVCLADYLSAGISESTTRRCAGPVWDYAQMGIARLARICGCTVPGRKQDTTASDLLLFLESERGEFFKWMRRQLYRLWREKRQPDEVLMTRYGQALEGVVGSSGGCHWTDEAKRFVKTTSGQGFAPRVKGSNTNPLNVYRHMGSGGQSLGIEVCTIHSEKGSEHLATLVLETRYHEHDLLVTLPLLLGSGNAPSGIRTGGHIRKVHVAMTRPRELLCLAVLSSHLTREQHEQLDSRDWDVKLV